MATIDAKVYVHHYKNDGTCNVKIRIYHKNQQRFIDTTHFLCDKQLKRHPENRTDERIDFIAFCTEFIAYLEENDRSKSADLVHYFC